jgi:hypothetical protein
MSHVKLVLKLFFSNFTMLDHMKNPQIFKSDRVASGGSS